MSEFCPEQLRGQLLRTSTGKRTDTIKFYIKNNPDSYYPHPLVITFHISKLHKHAFAADFCPGPPEFFQRLDKGDYFAPFFLLGSHTELNII